MEKFARVVLAALLAVGLNPVLAPRADALEAADLPGGAGATEASSASSVASVGGQEYDTLQAAVNAASGGTVTLLGDVDLGSNYVKVSQGSSATVDLAGHSVKSARQVFVNYGTFTVKDGTGGGKLEARLDCIVAMPGSDTTFESGTVEAVESAITTYSSGPGARVTVTGGTFSCSDNAVLRTNGSPGAGKNVLTVTGGHFNGRITTAGYVACGIYVANDDTVTVTGGTFNVTGGAGIVARAGEVSVSGNARFVTTGTGTGRVGDSRVVVPSAALVFDSDAKYPGMSDSSRITVAGGLFESEVAPVATVGEKSRISISGGSFSAEPDAAHIEDGCLAATTSGDFAGTHPSTIGRSVAEPSAETGLTWTGSTLTGVRAGAGYTVAGGSASAAGDHTATATLVSGYVWSDKTTAAKEIAWSIGRAPVAVPVARAGLVWNGRAQTGVAAGAGYSVAGGSASAAGDYTATATLDANHCWADGSVSAKRVSWSIGRAPVAVPGARTGLVWNGRAQTGVAAGAGYSVAGGSASAPGSYTATATLLDSNHCWADGSTAAKRVSWSIAKAAPGLSKSLKKTCKAKKLKKKAATFTALSVATDGTAAWKVVKKSKRLKFKAGKVTVRKGTKKGAYAMKVRLAASEGATRAALPARTYTVKVRVK